MNKFYVNKFDTKLPRKFEQPIICIIAINYIKENLLRKGERKEGGMGRRKEGKDKRKEGIKENKTQ